MLMRSPIGLSTLEIVQWISHLPMDIHPDNANCSSHPLGMMFLYTGGVPRNYKTLRYFPYSTKKRNILTTPSSPGATEI
jgi:hypothetical protein